MSRSTTVYVIHWLTNDTWEKYTNQTDFAIRFVDIWSFGFTEGEDYTAYIGTEKEEYISNPEPAYMQYIANTYHCSDCWGEKITEKDMYANLLEWYKEKDPDDYCPYPSQAKECADYWNQLCDLYPN